MTTTASAPWPALEPVAPPMRRLVPLLIGSLGLAAVAAMTTLVLRGSVIAYESGRVQLPDGTAVEMVRGLLEDAEWLRMGLIGVPAVISLWLTYLLLDGRRTDRPRVWGIAAAGPLAAVYLALAGDDPLWLRAGYGLQGVALALVVWTLLRPAASAAMARSPRPTAVPLAPRLQF